MVQRKSMTVFLLIVRMSFGKISKLRTWNKPPRDTFLEVKRWIPNDSALKRSDFATIIFPINNKLLIAIPSTRHARLTTSGTWKHVVSAWKDMREPRACRLVDCPDKGFETTTAAMLHHRQPALGLRTHTDTGADTEDWGTTDNRCRRRLPRMPSHAHTANDRIIPR